MPELSPSLKAEGETDCGVYLDRSVKREMHDCGRYVRIVRIGSKKKPYGGVTGSRGSEGRALRPDPGRLP